MLGDDSSFFLFFRQTIQYLLDNHLFDVSSVILSEGIPASDFGGRDLTNTLEIETDGNPKSNFVARFDWARCSISDPLTRSAKGLVLKAGHAIVWQCYSLAVL